MNDLLERYLGAVCSYFHGKKRIEIHDKLKKEILSSVTQLDDLEALLINYGHPRSLALSYGYRPLTQHIFNRKYVFLVQRSVLGLSFFYLFLSTIYYLFHLDCLPFLSNEHVASSFNSSNILTWILSHPIIIMSLICLIAIVILLILDYQHPVAQMHNTKWNIYILNKLPHPAKYPKHYFETSFIMIFSIYFILYYFFFNSHVLLQIQNASSQMIHLMADFFQPFIMIIYLDYFIDMTKKTYSKIYLKYSSLINLYILFILSTFIIDSHFLADFLLPLNISYLYILVNIFILGAILMIYLISLYKLIRNIKAYRSLFKD